MRIRAYHDRPGRGCFLHARSDIGSIAEDISVLAGTRASIHGRASRFRDAWGPGNVAASIANRVLLAGVDAEWAERTRQTLRSMRVRALSCLASAALANTEWPLAAQFARTQVELEPFRETGWQQLLRALAGAGNRAEALRAYAECRALLAKELGVPPSPETEAIVKGLRAAR